MKQDEKKMIWQRIQWRRHKKHTMSLLETSSTPLKQRTNVVGMGLGRCCIFVFTIFMLSTIDSKAFAWEQSKWTMEDVNVFLGLKNLDEDDWAPVDEHREFGIEIDFKQHNSPVNITIGYLRSSDDDTITGINIEGKTSELYIGVRKICEAFPQMRSFIGGGLSIISAEMKGAALGIKVSDDDSSLGFWLGGGVYFTSVANFNIGANIRYSQAEVNLFGIDGKAGGLHYGVIVRYPW